jgi:ABC-type glycerol-3-phosphate transport system permease component
MENVLARHRADDLPFDVLRHDHLYHQRVQDVHAGGCADPGRSVFWNRFNRVLLYLAIAALFALVVFPFYWMIVTSSLAAFAFASIDFKGKGILFSIVLSVMMIPAATTLIPNFLIIRTLGWYDKFYALIIPFAASVFGIFLLRQYFMSMPKELWEAAQIDGASRLRYFRSIALPLAKPAIVTIAINSFLGEKGQQWSQLAAASVFTTIPIVILFFFVQRQFIEGIGGGGIKG